jgi:HEPN domain-containing protein
MTNISLAESYILKAKKRRMVLELLLREDDYSDVIREAQELVELCIKGMLRFAGIEPPKCHDVGHLLLEHKEKFQDIVDEDTLRIAAISRELRKERELAFYGDIDFIPSEEYTEEDAKKAIDDARFVLDTATRIVIKR